MKKFLFLLPILIFCDLFLKYLAVNFLPLGGFYLFDNWLGLELFYNKYIAFSIPIPLYLLFFLNISIIMVIVYLFFKKMKEKNGWVSYELLAMVFLLSGALANLIDRLYNGFVIDYVVIGGFPVFNLADIMVVGGAFSWLVLEYFSEKCPRSSMDRTIHS